MGKFQDLTGKRFGKLTVLGRVGDVGKNTAWLCKCDCGEIKNILSYNLSSGKSKSCGCVRSAKLKKYATTHGESKTRLYQIYKGMKQRCNNANNPAYDYYGGKGVSVCNEWSGDFVKFKEWAIVNGYKQGMSIDRINPNGDYCPANCRWVSLQKQQNNKLNSMFVTIDNERLTIAEWADKNKTNKQTLYSKFYRLITQLGLENKDVIEFVIKCGGEHDTL